MDDTATLTRIVLPEIKLVRIDDDIYPIGDDAYLAFKTTTEKSGGQELTIASASSYNALEQALVKRYRAKPQLLADLLEYEMMILPIVAKMSRVKKAEGENFVDKRERVIAHYFPGFHALGNRIYTLESNSEEKNFVNGVLEVRVAECWLEKADGSG